MRQTGFFHHIGTFLLFTAMILLIISSITAPTVGQISMLRVVLSNDNTNNVPPSITFGTFGYCINDANTLGSRFCSQAHIGYNAADIITSVDASTKFSSYAADTTNALTRVMILHPVSAGMAFISFLLALGAGVVGSFLASLVALATVVVTLVVLITDFVWTGLIKNAVNDAHNGSYGEWGAGSWTTLVACILEFIAMIVIFFTCCSARLHNRRSRTVSKPDGWVDGPAPAATRRRWF